MIFQGRSIGGLSPRDILRQGTAQIPQDHSLFPDMTVRENMELGGLLLGNRRLITNRLREVEEIFPIIRERAMARAGNLSGGQQRQIEIAAPSCLIPNW